MYWRNKAAKDAKQASIEALEARKETAEDPESMYSKAFFYRRKFDENQRYKPVMDKYWKSFAAHDPEIAARFAMYWRENSEADMYW